jgi:sugar phosphate isomerase/epimerase
MDAGLDDINWVLFAGTLGFGSSIDARVEAAHATGCTRVSLGAPDVARLAEDGVSGEDLGRRLRGEGLTVGMDPVMAWYGGTPLANAFGEFGLDDEMRMCEALQVSWMSAIGPFMPADVSDDLVDRFGALCDRAADFGAQVQYEFMPISAIADLTTAWDIVQAADRSNGGVAFDTWHFFRGNPDWAALEALPGDRVYSVQVSDGRAEVRGSLSEDTMNRLVPGDGVFDLVGVLRVLDRIGALGWVGPEVISPATEAMDPVDAAQLTIGRTRELIAQARA